MYFDATEHWQTTWASQVPAAKTLSRHFKTILHTLKGLAKNQLDRQIATLFTRGRDAFRDVLSGGNPGMFKRHGQVDACLIDILDSLSRNQSSSRYFSFISSCGGSNCNLRVTTPAGAPFMLSPDIWTSITHSENPPYHESLQEWVNRFVDHKASSSLPSCSGCSAEYSKTRSFLRPPWIWFEVFVGKTDVVLPSFKLLLSSQAYRLAAVIYGDNCHFVARLSTQSGTWWYYNGQVNGGRPVADPVTRREDLLTCGGGYTINALVYCLTR